MSQLHREALALYETLLALPPELRQRRFEELAKENDPRYPLLCALRASPTELALDSLPSLDSWSGFAAPLLQELTLPCTCGEFELLERLGQGASGTVFRARQTTPPRFVAVKLLHANAATESQNRRFELEIRALARLDHPGIVRIFSAGIADIHGQRTAFLATELVEGESLHAYLERRRPSLTERLQLWMQLCEIVDYAHRRGVIHRDLKPANLLFCEDEHGNPAIKVLDFGIARLHEHEGSATHLTGAGIVGTLGYIAPERLDPEVRDLDEVRCEVFSLGAIGYEMLTGESLFDLRGVPLLQALDRRRRSAADPLRSSSRQKRGAIDPMVRAILQAALQPEPHARYASPGDLAADIQRHLRHEPIRAVHMGWIRRGGLFLHRHWLGVSVVCAALVAAVFIALTAYAALEAEHRLEAQSRLQFESNTQELDAVLGTEITELVRLIGPHPLVFLFCSRAEKSLQRARELRAEDSRIFYWGAQLDRIRGNALDASGLWHEALAHFRSGLAQRERLASLDPRREVLLDLATDLVRIGDMAYRIKGEKETYQLYSRAHEVYLEIARHLPDDRRALDDLAWSHDRMQLVCHAKEDYAGMIDHVRAMDRVASRLRQVEPDHWATLRTRSRLDLQIGLLCARIGEFAAARPHFELSFRLAEALCAMDQNRRDSLEHFLDAAQNLSGLYLALAARGHAGPALHPRAEQILDQAESALARSTEVFETRIREISAQFAHNRLLAHALAFRPGKFEATRQMLQMRAEQLSPSWQTNLLEIVPTLKRRVHAPERLFDGLLCQDSGTMQYADDIGVFGARMLGWIRRMREELDWGSVDDSSSSLPPPMKGRIELPAEVRARLLEFCTELAGRAHE